MFIHYGSSAVRSFRVDLSSRFELADSGRCTGPVLFRHLHSDPGGDRIHLEIPSGEFGDGFVLAYINVSLCLHWLARCTFGFQRELPLQGTNPEHNQVKHVIALETQSDT